MKSIFLSAGEIFGFPIQIGLRFLNVYIFFNRALIIIS